MLISLLFSNPLAFAILAGSLVVCLTIHEYAHAAMADRLGDPTPRLQGRVTLNPLAHLDPLGTILLLFVGFGWGKPVMFDPYNLQNVRRDTLLIALAGPASNILMAFVLLLVSALWPISGVLGVVVSFLISINILLAAFNLIPIHPLDGGKILAGLLPERLADEFDDILYRYGFIILIILIFPLAGGSPISAIISPLTAGIEHVLRSIVQMIVGMF